MKMEINKKYSMQCKVDPEKAIIADAQLAKEQDYRDSKDFVLSSLAGNRHHVKFNRCITLLENARIKKLDTNTYSVTDTVLERLQKKYTWTIDK